MIFVPVPGTKVQFCIWETRVQDFTAFVNATGFDATKDMFSLADGGFVKDGHSWKNPGFEQGPTHPVVAVSWNDTKAFCAWLSEKERKEGFIQTNQAYRLPTDAEWSAAVGLSGEVGRTPAERFRAAKSSLLARARQEKREWRWVTLYADCAYPWGSKWPPPRDFANYPQDLGVDTYPFTTPVGSFRSNQVGICDLSGNVWEWCEDLYAKEASSRTYRGASFTQALPEAFASWARAYGEPSERYLNRGFRVVLTSAL